MDERSRIVRHAFWALALLWLPAGVAAQAAVRLLPGVGAPAEPGTWISAVATLAMLAPCGLPLALACRRVWRLQRRRTAWAAGIVLGTATIAASLIAGLLGPLAIAACAAALSLPVWFAWRWLARRG